MKEFSLIFVTMAKLALRNVLRNWRHSAATLLAISCGFTAISLFDGFIKELIRKLDDDVTARYMVGDVIFQVVQTEKERQLSQWKYPMGAREQKFIEQFLAADPAVVTYIKRLNFTGYLNYENSTSFFLAQSFDVPQDAKVRGEKWAFDTIAGLPLHLSQEPSPLLLGSSLAKLIGCSQTASPQDYELKDGSLKPEDRPFSCKNAVINVAAMTENAQNNALDMRVVGIVDGGLRQLDRRLIKMPLAEAQKLLDTDKISIFSVRLKSRDESPAFLERARAALAGGGLSGAIEAISWRNHPVGRFFQGGQDILNVFRNIFMTIIVIIGIMSVSNTMKKSVNERIREIGTLRSIGFFRSHLISMFAFEAIFLSVAACFAGLVLTMIISVIVNHSGITYTAGVTSTPVLLKLLYAPKAWASSAMLLTLLAMLTGLSASFKASHMVIADTLRHVE